MRKVFYCGLLLTLVQVVSIQAQTLIGFQQKGRASYYASKFHGRRTANGERFSNQELTAAHRTLPFNTMVKVTNTANGKEVLVRVNDRGPVSKNKLIDLSKAAAEQLDMIRAGVAPVIVEVIGVDGMVATHPTPYPEGTPDQALKPRSLTPQSAPITQRVTTLPGRKPASDEKFITGNSYSLWGTPKNPDGYGVQIGSYESLDNAKDLCRELIAKKQEAVFINVEPSEGKKMYRVLAGDFNVRRDAQQYLSLLQEIGFAGIIYRHAQ